MKPAGAKLPGTLGKVTSVLSPGDPSRVLTRWEGRRPKRRLPSGHCRACTIPGLRMGIYADELVTPRPLPAGGGTARFVPGRQ